MMFANIVGARPQFMKAAPVSRALRAAAHAEYLVHTGQHYDVAMSDVFFTDLGMRAPDVNLGVGSGLHGQQTGEILARVERVLLDQSPDGVIVYGDTNTTLGAALAACKLRIPLAHVEAGLRSYNRSMPEEHNRVLTDHCADLLFCPTATAKRNLEQEGITRGVFVVGDTMTDSLLEFGEMAERTSTALERFGLTSKQYVLVTLHRPYTADDPSVLSDVLSTLATIDEPVIFPVHPRTRQRIDSLGVARSFWPRHHQLVDPLGYLDMLKLTRNARLVLTDSGGLQKEAYCFEVPCVTVRPETEWVETVQAGMNVVVGHDRKAILAAVARRDWPQNPPRAYGDGTAATQIVGHLTGQLSPRATTV
jgi:UDP-N-acetylglucosamine 2-epimerase